MVINSAHKTNVIIHKCIIVTEEGAPQREVRESEHKVFHLYAYIKLSFISDTVKIHIIIL